MNTNKTTKKRFFGIIALMAKLLEQRRMVWFFYNFNKEAIWPKDKDEEKSRIIEKVGEGKIFEREFLNQYHQYILRYQHNLKEKRDVANIMDQENILFQSCLDDGFLRTVNSISSFRYILITTKGTELLHSLGFLNIVVEKYSKIFLFLSGLGVAIILLIVRAILNHFWNLNL